MVSKQGMHSLAPPRHSCCCQPAGWLANEGRGGGGGPPPPPPPLCPSSTGVDCLCAVLRCTDVPQVVIVPDDVDAICREIRSLSAAHDVVLTAGGLGALVACLLSLCLCLRVCASWHGTPLPCPAIDISVRAPAAPAPAAAAAGPTLDDVTMAALAEAFGQKLALHPQLEARIRAYFGGGGILTPAHLKLAEAPTGACVCWRGRLLRQAWKESMLLCLLAPSPAHAASAASKMQGRRCSSLSSGWRAAPTRPSPCCAAATSTYCPASRRCCRYCTAVHVVHSKLCCCYSRLCVSCQDSEVLNPAGGPLTLPPCAPRVQKKWRAVEAHLQANAPQQAPFQTALLRLRLRDETQVRRRCS